MMYHVMKRSDVPCHLRTSARLHLFLVMMLLASPCFTVGCADEAASKRAEDEAQILETVAERAEQVAAAYGPRDS